MIRIAHLLLLVALVVVAGFGCSDRSSLVEPDVTQVDQITASKALSLFQSGALQSATLNIYVSHTHAQTVDVFRITENWEETIVTWNNFGGAYDETMIWGSFVANPTGWHSVDITPLVQAWMDGSYENFGLLLAQSDSGSARTEFFSREDGAHTPYLEICFLENTTPSCISSPTTGDATISEADPDANWGTISLQLTGWPKPPTVGYEKQALLKFELPETHEESGCTRTIGYWKNHAGFGPQADDVTPLLPIWLGAADGAKSMKIETAQQAVDVLKMKTYGRNRNGITKLYAQLLAAKLNIASGASGLDVSNVIIKADTFLAEHNWQDWWKMKRAEKKRVLRWQRKLDRYNNGKIGPGHCDSFGDDGDDD